MIITDIFYNCMDSSGLKFFYTYKYDSLLHEGMHQVHNSYRTWFSLILYHGLLL